MIKKSLAPFLLLFLAVSCSPTLSADDQLTQAVQAALSSASDLPQSGLMIAAESGVITVTGTIECEDCGGLRTPGGIDNVRLSLGAVIRAVPGVEQVEFFLN
jgi:hypothetical protein